ncbi:ras-related protein Rab-24-like isoform X1 [Strongylocentrotus purpuratus]|uniref:Ras-related protein Rab-24 n=1 Tax=Strongylocentrotus purpuratus TaxID=7668 RepID=A0A7M7NU00_STRPU|nr:ras-related protein Rab-24 isoform X1 [Strongylocentrotus purpuratus]XP_030841478.1 ras-related protein Rab-24-like isoform X1 [Strongylocentrotus purpuratus]
MSGSRVDLKVVLLGKEYGGKTSLVERYLHDRFHGDVPYQNVSTIGAAFGAKKVDVYDRTVTMGVWDTAGSERYEAMSRIYYRGAKAAIVCYDLTDELSFGKARFWVEELLKNEEHCKIYLCGTKVDLVQDDKRCRKVDYHVTTDYADEIRAQVFETSSKTGHNIKDLFFKIAKDFVDDPKNNENGEETPNTLKLSENSHKKSCPC